MKKTAALLLAIIMLLSVALTSCSIGDIFGELREYLTEEEIEDDWNESENDESNDNADTSNDFDFPIPDEPYIPDIPDEPDEPNISDILIYESNIDGTAYSVVGVTDTEQTKIIIPDTYANLPVTSIGEYAFKDCTNLTSITIGNSVESIGDYAFGYCKNLTSVSIPDSVTSIDSSAFYDCYKLVEVYNLSSLTIEKGSTSNGYVGYYALNVYTPTDGESKLYTTGDGYVFYVNGGTIYLLGYVGADTELVLPKSYNGSNYEIYQYAFYRNENITSVEILDSVKSIGDYAFGYCSSLASITIPDSVDSIGSYVFFNCTSLNAVYIADLAKWCSISFAGSYSNPLFYEGNLYLNRTLVTNLEIPNGVESISIVAFTHCASLTSITIPDSVKSISSFTFGQCTSLESITVEAGNTKYKSDGNCLIEIATNTLILGCKNSVIPNYVKRIGSYAFLDCVGLKSITIPDSVERIEGECMFDGCTSLESVTIGNGVKIIGQNAFSNCTSLKRITIPDSVTEIHPLAFDSCTNLESVTIGNGLTSIGQYVFRYCKSLISVNIPDGVKVIYAEAFSGCTSLESITYNGTVEQWNAIEKASDWNNNTGNYTVTCTDGTIAKS